MCEHMMVTIISVVNNNNNNVLLIYPYAWQQSHKANYSQALKRTAQDKIV
jgi:hypothetical protein